MSPARALALLLMLPAVARAAEPPPDFARDVAPVLERSCVRCHRPGHAKGDVSLATSADLVRGGHVVPGEPDESGVLALVTPAAGGKRPRMPKDGQPLAAAEVAVLRRWIAGGANWPKELVLRERARADRSWWSLRPLADVTRRRPTACPRRGPPARSTGSCSPG